MTDGRGSCRCGWAAEFHTALRSGISLVSQTLSKSFHQEHLLENLFWRKKADNIFSQAVKEPLRASILIILFGRKRIGFQPLSQIPHLKGGIVKELCVALVIMAYLDNAKLKIGLLFF